MAYTVLLIESELARAAQLAAALVTVGAVVRTAADLAAAREVLAAGPVEAVVVRHLLPDGSAFDLAPAVPGAALLIGVEEGDEAVAARALDRGFDDFLVFDGSGGYLDLLARQVDSAVVRRQAQTRSVLVNERVARQNQLLQAILKAHSNFLVADAPGAAFDALLEDFLQLTRSGYGLIAEVLYDPQDKPYLRCYALTDISWDDATRAAVARHAQTGMLFNNLDTLFGSALVTGKAVISNAPPTDPRSGGLPTGHAPLDAFLGLPVHASGRLVAFVGVANRPGGYDQDDVDFLQPLVITVGQLVEARRAQSERLVAEQGLRESEARWRRLSELSSDWYWEQDAQLRMSRIDGGILRSTGTNGSAYRGLSAWELPAIGVSETRRRALRQQMESHEVFQDFEMAVEGDDGMPHWISISGTPVHGPDGAFMGYNGIGRNITDRKKADARIEQLAFHDELTGLPNRRGMIDRLQQALADSSKLGRSGAVLLLDLDNFKDLNDTLGHEFGDQLLQQVAQRIRGCARPHDTVGRLGGDEFVLLLEGLSSELDRARQQAETMALAVLQSLRMPHAAEQADVLCTPSIGIVLFQDHLLPVDELLKRADLAMYESKANGRNTCSFFDPKMLEAVSKRLRLESDLRHALAQRALVLVYQPVVDRAGALVGVEALVRWPHPQRGMVSPVDFIPVAEQTGLIVVLGRQVQEEACRQLVAWEQDARTRQLTIAVNVSAYEFRHPHFVQQLIETVERAGADPRRLKLELTESLLLHDVQDTVAKMHALKAVGIALALDDFGTGYSSLNYLKRLPLDTLKIDQSFVRGILTDPHDAAIAGTIVRLARSLGLRVVAEGVETEGQRDYLLASGCEYLQGYLFGRPAPVEALEKFWT